jgi:hypothetical protein
MPRFTVSCIDLPQARDTLGLQHIGRGKLICADLTSVNMSLHHEQTSEDGIGFELAPIRKTLNFGMPGARKPHRP